MYPQFELPYGITIYTFGISLSVGFLLFFWMLHKLSGKYGVNTNFFIGNVLSIFLSIFIFSRLFYFLAEYRDFVSDGFTRFFFTSDYNVTLAGGVFWFFAVLLYQLKKHNLSHERYLDVAVVAFLFAAVVGYVGAFLWGQIYGKPTYLPFWITYTDPESTNPYTSPVVPLALVYAFFSFIIFVILYISRVAFIKVEGLVGYVGMASFSCVLLIGEFWNGSEDSLKNLFFLNLTQIMAVVCILFTIRWFAMLAKKGA